MKKVYGAVVALLMSLLFVFAGCKADGGKVLTFLKTKKEFVGNPSSSESYRVGLTVNEDLSYSLSVGYGVGALQNYSAEGEKIEYLGYDTKEFTTEWLGIQQNNTAYDHVLKLPKASFVMNDREYAFYLVANTQSKRSDSFALTLVAYWRGENAVDDRDNLSQIVNSSLSFRLKTK